MASFSNRAKYRSTNFKYLRACLLSLLALAAIAGCKSSGHTDDPQLRKIDEILDPQLPKGTPMARVSYFLSSRGYTVENSNDPHAMVAIVRHIDTETLQPITARVTFHFDANDKLVTYDLSHAPDMPIHP